jgi:hypothetical protein
MANQEQVDIIRQGREPWEQWRRKSSEVWPDLSGADLAGADLRRINLSNCNLSGAKLNNTNLSGAFFTGSNLYEAQLTNAILTDANFYGAALIKADLSGANLHRASFVGARLIGTNFTGANLRRANLTHTTLTQAIIERANLSECSVYGISAWNLKGVPQDQSNLIITRDKESTVTVDDIEVAQFVYLLLNNKKIRNVIDTITSKAVLILGRFTPERKCVLDELRIALRRHGYLPILFDFEKPEHQNLTETVSTLAHLAKFVIADITDAKSIPQELQRIVPDRPSLPVQPLILSEQYEWSMFESFRDYPWVLLPFCYDDLKMLLASLEEKVIAPAEAKVKEIEERRGAFEKGMKRAR